MNIRQALTNGAAKLAGIPGVDDPKFESEVLLRHVLDINRSQFFLDLDKELNAEKANLFDEWIKRRSQGEPVAYITKHREFFGLDFYVDRRVLIPRPETELLVEEAIGYLNAHPGINVLGKIIAADIGTGSGAVAISLAVNVPQARIYATDISTLALEVASINCRKHNVTKRVILLQGDLLDPLSLPVDILIANLPYVTWTELARMPSVRCEPQVALDGGETGHDKIFQLCRQLKGKVKSGGCVLLEIGMGQDKALISLLRNLFPSSEIKPLVDLAGINRAVILTSME